MQPIPVRPDRFCRSSRHSRDVFRLVLDSFAAEEFVLVGEGAYRSYEVLHTDRAGSADHLLGSALLDDADVLVISRGALARPARPSSAPAAASRLTVLPCATTPTGTEDLGVLLSALERCASDGQTGLAQRLLAAFEAAGSLRLVDGPAAVEATLDLNACHVSRSRYFRALSLAAAAGPGMALPLTGRLVVRGRPIVRTLDPRRRAAGQKDLYEALLVLLTTGAVLDVLAGAVTAVAPSDPADPRAADALSRVLDADPAHRVVTGIGVGLDLDAQPLPGNHEANTAVGGTAGQVFVTLGDLDRDAFEVVLPASAGGLVDADGAVVAGQDPAVCEAAPRRRLNRVKSASCGCH